MGKKLLFLIIFCTLLSAAGQETAISLYTQFSGPYDFVTIGNTLNISENNSSSTCTILTSSSASLNLNADDQLEAAYLYWGGSGTGDLEVTLNGTVINSERNFNTSNTNRDFFAAFADVTTLVQNTGNGTYTLADLDLTNVLITNSAYCATGTNFGGWAIVCIYKNPDLPLQQLNVYDGLESVKPVFENGVYIPDSLTINLNDLLVIDNSEAKIGFLAWEGDLSLSVTETLTINGNIVSNPPLNPANNAFNSTNSFTGSATLYNMDIDYYNLESYVNIGDTNVSISLTSGQDYVLINNIVTVLGNVLPDASPLISGVIQECDSRTVILDFTVANTGTSELAIGTPISIYANNTLIELLTTTTTIGVNDAEHFSISVIIPDIIPDGFTITVIVDENNIVEEIDETNNTSNTLFTLQHSPEIPELNDASGCDVGFNTAVYYLSDLINTDTSLIFSGFFETEEDAQTLTNPINYEIAYEAQDRSLYYRYDDSFCYSIGTLQLKAANCPPRIPQGFSPNNDGINDVFNIQGLWNVFESFDLKIYNRYGTLLYQGNENTKPWDGEINTETLLGKSATTGTYYYVLKLNDELYNVYTGWVYLNK